MRTRLRALFDGQVLRPEEPASLTPNTHYVVTIETEDPAPAARTADVYPLAEILALATDMGVEDLATEHDAYSHGRPADDPA